MIRRNLRIGRWLVYFLFVKDRYDKEMILSFLDTFGASDSVMARADKIMTDGFLNRAFTFANPDMRRALVVTGPTSSGMEFLNSFSHELRHLADSIAKSIGYDLDAEEPAYMTGDAVRDLAEVVCELGCPHCHS